MSKMSIYKIKSEIVVKIAEHFQLLDNESCKDALQGKLDKVKKNLNCINKSVLIQLFIEVVEEVPDVNVE